MMATDPKHPSDQNETRARILVVDDVPDNLGVLLDLLEDEGAEVQVATSGEAALEIVALHRPDLILLDVRMPGMDGFETCRRLRAMDGLEELPIIFLTAEVDVTKVREGFDVGGMDYVTKPFDKEALLVRVHTHLKRSRLPRAQEEETRERLLDSPDVLEALTSSEIFHDLDKDALRPLLGELNWVSLLGGQRLIRQGEYGTAIYIMLSGRLRVTLEHKEGQEHNIAEVGRGECVGEISVLTDGATTAHVYAIRDSTLIQIPKEIFKRFIAQHPIVLDNVNQLLIRRIKIRHRTDDNAFAKNNKTITLIPANSEVPLTVFAEQLTQALSCYGSVMHLNAQRVDQHLGQGKAQISQSGETYREVTAWLNRQDAAHQMVVYQADTTPSAWTLRCLRHADRVLIVGQPGHDPSPGAVEAELTRYEGLAHRDLVLLHTMKTTQPKGTSKWLHCREVDTHHHIRLGKETDLKRLARILTGRAIALALSGGSARGYAHIGVIKALAESGIPIDMIGGTSSGATLAAHHVLGWTNDQIIDAHIQWLVKRKAMHIYTLPLMSIAADRKWNAAIRDGFGETHIEDLWINYFCVSTNLTQGKAHIHQSGLLWEAIRATSAMPAYFPPSYFDGDLHVDGGVINNLPIDIMRAKSEGYLIASDVSSSKEIEKSTLDYWERSGWQLLYNRLNPFAKKIKAPLMHEVISRTMEVNTTQARNREIEQADLYLRPPVQSFSWFDPKPIKEIAKAGYCYATETLTQLDREDQLPVF